MVTVIKGQKSPFGQIAEALGTTLESVSTNFQEKRKAEKKQEKETEQLGGLYDTLFEGTDDWSEEKRDAFIQQGPDLAKISSRLLAEAPNKERMSKKEMRLQLDSENKKYTRTISDLKEDMKNQFGDVQKATRQSIKDLRKEQTQNERLIRQGKQGRTSVLDSAIGLQEKAVFDPKSEEHIQIKEEILQKAGGDRNQANQLLNQMFR